MPLENIAQILFQACITGIMGIAVKFLYDLKTSVNDLNIKVAVVIDKVANHERRIAEHSDRLSSLEKN